MKVIAHLAVVVLYAGCIVASSILLLVDTIAALPLTASMIMSVWHLCRAEELIYGCIKWNRFL